MTQKILAETQEICLKRKTQENKKSDGYTCIQIQTNLHTCKRIEKCPKFSPMSILEADEFFNILKLVMVQHVFFNQPDLTNTDLLQLKYALAVNCCAVLTSRAVRRRLGGRRSEFSETLPSGTPQVLKSMS